MGAGYRASGLRTPAGRHIDGGNPRLDVENGRPVEGIRRVDADDPGLRVERGDNDATQRDRVRPDGRAQGEDTARPVGMTRRLDDQVALAPIHPVEHLNRLTDIQARKTRRETGQQFDPRGLAGFPRGTQVLGRRPPAPWRSDMADETERSVPARGGIEVEGDFALARAVLS